MYNRTQRVFNFQNKVINKMVTTFFTPVFSVTCIAAILRNTSPDIVFRQAKQTRIEIHQSQPTSMTCDSFPKKSHERTLACDWCISILVYLACRKTLEDDVKRWMTKDWCYARNTESKCNVNIFRTRLHPSLTERAIVNCTEDE